MRAGEGWETVSSSPSRPCRWPGPRRVVGVFALLLAVACGGAGEGSTTASATAGDPPPAAAAPTAPPTDLATTDVPMSSDNPDTDDAEGADGVKGAEDIEEAGGATTVEPTATEVPAPTPAPTPLPSPTCRDITESLWASTTLTPAVTMALNDVPRPFWLCDPEADDTLECWVDLTASVDAAIDASIAPTDPLRLAPQLLCAPDPAHTDAFAVETAVESADAPPAAEPVVIVDEEMVIAGEVEHRMALFETPNGARTFLGTNDRPHVGIDAVDIGTHNLLTISFDIVVGGPWAGYNGAGQGLAGVSAGGSTLFYSSFSTTPGFEQTWPNASDDGVTWPAFTGADETNTLGWSDIGFGDAVYRFETQFAHNTPEFDLVLTAFPERTNAGIGLDNLEIIASNETASEFRSAIEVRIDDDSRVHIVGTVPNEDLRVAFLNRLEQELGVHLGTVELDVVGGFRPAWLPGIARNLATIRETAVRDFRWTLNGFSAQMSGTVASEADRDDVMRVAFPTARGFPILGGLTVESN